MTDPKGTIMGAAVRLEKLGGWWSRCGAPKTKGAADAKPGEKEAPAGKGDAEHAPEVSPK